MDFDLSVTMTSIASDIKKTKQVQASDLVKGKCHKKKEIICKNCHRTSHRVNNVNLEQNLNLERAKIQIFVRSPFRFCSKFKFLTPIRIHFFPVAKFSFLYFAKQEIQM
jgi:hypothetical protein